MTPAQKVKKLRQDRIAAGLCACCGEESDRPGMYYRSQCLVRENQKKEARRNQLSREGYCAQCGRKKDREGRFCSNCKDEIVEAVRAKRKNCKVLLNTKKEVEPMNKVTMYFRVKPMTPEHEICKENTAAGKRWIERLKEIREFVGLEKFDFECSQSQLGISEVPEHLKSQFLKNPVGKMYRAKLNSKINKQWIQFCEERNLHEVGSYWIAQQLKVRGLYSVFYALNVGDEYYFEVTCGGYEIDHWRGLNYLEELTEPQYLRIKADYLEAKGA